MDPFDDNGLNEIWLIFGKVHEHTAYLRETESKAAGNIVSYERESETPENLEISSACPDEPRQDTENFKSDSESGMLEECNINSVISYEMHGTKFKSNSKTGILKSYDKDEASLGNNKTDIARQNSSTEAECEITRNDDKNKANRDERESDKSRGEIFEACHKNGGNPIEHENNDAEQNIETDFTSQVNEEHSKNEVALDDDEYTGQTFDSDARLENDIPGMAFTSNGEGETFKEYAKDEASLRYVEHDAAGQKFRIYTTEILEECAKDEASPFTDRNDDGRPPAESDAALALMQEKSEQCKVLQRTASGNKTRATSQKGLPNRLLFVRTQSASAIVACPIRILLQILCFVVGFLCCISSKFFSR